MYQNVEYDECLICYSSLFRGFSLKGLLNNDQLCYNCRQLLTPKLKCTTFNEYKLYYLYEYKEHSSKLLIRYKDYLDTSLASIFLAPLTILIFLLKNHFTVVLIPSSPSMIKRRGFNHLKLMWKNHNVKIADVLSKDDSVQRFSKSRKVSFNLIKHQKYNNILLFDDVVTSGNSLNAALKLLSPKAERITIFCLFYNVKEVK